MTSANLTAGGLFRNLELGLTRYDPGPVRQALEWFDLLWDEAVRLDLRYVENWSFALDLQILWKTWSAVFRGSGAY